MFSLPDIKRMNEEKVRAYNERKSKEKVCEHCDKKATKSFEYYDIYSETPQYLDFCDECYEEFEENGREGYFYCDICDRYYMTNITWENHYVAEDGEFKCLNCKTKEVFGNPVSFEEIESLDFESLRHAPHVIGVRNHMMEKWVEDEGFKRIGTITADNMTGGKVIGFSTSTDSDDTAKSFKEFVKKNGFTDFVVCIDGAYQFAVDLSLYAK